MYMCMYICIYMYIYVYAFVSHHVTIGVSCRCWREWECVIVVCVDVAEGCVLVYTCMCARMYVDACMCAHVCVDVCMCAHVHMCVRACVCTVRVLSCLYVIALCVCTCVSE